MVFHHSRDVQIFKYKNIVGIDKKSGNLVNKISSFIFDSVVNFRNYLSLFMAFIASFLLFAQSSLSRCKNLFIGFKKARIVYFDAVRESSERRNSNVNSYAFICRLKNFFRRFNRKTRKPFSAAITRNGQSFYFSDNGTVKFNFNFSDFGKSQTIVRNRESALSEGKGIVSLFVLKTRKASFTLSGLHTAKESLKSLINSFENVLRNLAVNAQVFGIGNFYFGKLVGLVVVIQRNAIEFVSITTLLQTCIKQISTQIERIYEFGCLCLTRKNAKTKVFNYNRFSHCFLLILKSISVRLGIGFALLFPTASILPQTQNKIHKGTRLSTTNFKANWKWSCANF